MNETVELSVKAQSLSGELRALGISAALATSWAAQAVDNGGVSAEESKGVLSLYGPVVPQSEFSAQLEKEYGIATFSAASVKARLADMKGDITIPMHSPGGLWFEMVAIKAILSAYARDQGARITTRADGQVGSAAAALFLMGDERQVEPMANIMFHEVMLSAINLRPKGLKDAYETAIKWNAQQAQWVSERTDISADAFAENVDNRDWNITAQEAVDNGIATAILTAPKSTPATESTPSASDEGVVARAEADIRATLSHPDALIRAASLPGWEV